MGLSWQQGPLSPGAIGRFLIPDPLPKRLVYAERLRWRMRVRFGGSWIADSENVVVLFEPAHANELNARVAFAWPAMDTFYEEDERIRGHAADSYHHVPGADVDQSALTLVDQRTSAGNREGARAWLDCCR